jgi:hypothetical protein
VEKQICVENADLLGKFGCGFWNFLTLQGFWRKSGGFASFEFWIVSLQFSLGRVQLN